MEQKQTNNYLEAIIDPKAKPRMTKSDAWRGRPVVLDYWKFKDELIKQADKQSFVLGNAYHVIFHIPMPKAWSKKKKEAMNYADHTSRPDLDNLVKSVNDCLKSGDDSSVHSIVAHKLWVDRTIGSIIITNYESIPIWLLSKDDSSITRQ